MITYLAKIPDVRLWLCHCLTAVVDALNQPTQRSRPGQTTTYGYDAIGRLTSGTDTLGGTLTWMYDVVGKHPRVAEAPAPSWWDMASPWATHQAQRPPGIRTPPTPTTQIRGSPGSSRPGSCS
jgi:YD repeat-containing protein